MKRVSWAYLSKELSSILNHLEVGSVFVCSTDTVIGLLARACQSEIIKINAVKKRPSLQPPIILVKDKQQALEWACIKLGSKMDKLMNYWPAPLTLIVPLRPEKKRLLGIEDNCVALRVPDHQGLLSLLVHCDGLISTSANIHGCAVPTRFSELDATIIASCEYGISDTLNDADQYPAVPSTIVDCTGLTPVVVREGAFIVPELT